MPNTELDAHLVVPKRFVTLAPRCQVGQADYSALQDTTGLSTADLSKNIRDLEERGWSESLMNAVPAMAQSDDPIGERHKEVTIPDSGNLLLGGFNTRWQHSEHFSRSIYSRHRPLNMTRIPSIREHEPLQSRRIRQPDVAGFHATYSRVIAATLSRNTRRSSRSS